MQLYPENIGLALDFEAVKQHLTRYCSTEQTKAKVLALQPTADHTRIHQDLQATNEILALLQAGQRFPSTRFEPMDEAVQHLKTPGRSLDEASLDLVRSALRSYGQLFEFLKQNAGSFPHLFAPVEPVPPLPQVIQRIDQVLDPQAAVRSQASPALARIREKLQQSRASAARIFARCLRKYTDKGWLADFGESVAENRRVLAVDAAHKGKIQGIFHGSSSRGSIAFIEPGETVEVNNEVSQLMDDERQEIHRILRALSDTIRPEAPAMQAVHHQQVFLDFTRAKAHYAFDENACLPSLTPGEPGVVLREAWHPILRQLNREKGQDTQPLNLELHPEQHMLVISGPNAGGKTVALKTLGLLCLMLQSGLPVPVHPQSRFGIFHRLMADIGDTQSLQDELSTYSAKLKKMRYFLQHTGPSSLLLIDEFGSGSDPDLGSALARVFLEALHQRGTYAILTTHYNGIKALAADLPGVENAAMLFDRQSLRPLYRLEIGQPGSSYTFEVAGQSGIPLEIIARARDQTNLQVMEVDRLLSQLQSDKVQLEREGERLSSELREVSRLRQEREKTIAQQEEKLQRQGRQNEENDQLIRWGQRFRKLVESWQKQPGKKEKKQIVARFLALLQQESNDLEENRSRQQTKAQRKKQNQREKLLKLPVKVGDPVQVLDRGFRGTIRSIQNDRYVIALGENMTTTLNREQFIPIQSGKGSNS